MTSYPPNPSTDFIFAKSTYWLHFRASHSWNPLTDFISNKPTDFISTKSTPACEYLGAKWPHAVILSISRIPECQESYLSYQYSVLVWLSRFVIAMMWFPAVVIVLWLYLYCVSCHCETYVLVIVCIYLRVVSFFDIFVSFSCEGIVLRE